MRLYDLCVIGGGFSGIFSAITVAEKGKSVIVLEKNKKPLKKLYATGNGKCNITNESISFVDNYHSSSEKKEEYLKEILGDKSNTYIKDFFNKLGLLTYYDEGYMYPVNNQASAVAWSLLDYAKRTGFGFYAGSGSECGSADG